jgi:hypothetical protein
MYPHPECDTLNALLFVFVLVEPQISAVPACLGTVIHPDWSR